MVDPKGGCFSSGKKLLSLESALEKLEKLVRPTVGVEKVGLAGALSKFLAEDVLATCNVPPHDNSAVDGYAVCHADLSIKAAI